jgi:hypothetical protein
LEPGGALVISADVDEMLATVDLDNQLSLYAGEIDDIGTEWNLAAEVVAVDLLSTESHPETGFSIGHLGAEFASSLNFGARGAHTDHLQKGNPSAAARQEAASLPQGDGTTRTAGL